MEAELEDGNAGYGTLVVMLEAPTAADDIAGRPFVSQSGRYVRDEIGKRWQGHIVYDYAVRCAPGAMKVGDKHTAACRKYTAGALDEAKPVAVLCFGTDAIESVLGKGYAPLGCRRGYAHTSTGVPVFFLIHPVMAMKNRLIRGWLEDDLDWVFGIGQTQLQARLTPAPAAPPMAATRAPTLDPAEAAVQKRIDAAVSASHAWDNYEGDRMGGAFSAAEKNRRFMEDP